MMGGSKISNSVQVWMNNGVKGTGTKLQIGIPSSSHQGDLFLTTGKISPKNIYIKLKSPK
jgi:hypothetical protein